MDAFDVFKKPINKLDQFPYLPVNVFKDEYNTGSKKNIFKLPLQVLQVIILLKYF